MEGFKNNSMYIGKGVLRGCVLTVIIAFILALIQTFSSIGESALSVCILITSMISIMYASIYATKKINNKGWFIGLLVALLYMLILYITAIILGKDGLAVKDLWRVLLALVTGALSGMLGINL
ncbi:TIGR04086 family membrane protein [Clostridium swellfunianum]|uniref:TIGR04086 family membrane protein n=1 Tax=Clostridium swellfunianum TaxID=1367462 RepID=UPI00202EA1A9|nr:TIGR04086 family membrane protein [Clostridium swellfunianum]MCM0648801.1 TIGR04086 family membrane protein [Clostridium swellfunianum]